MAREDFHSKKLVLTIKDVLVNLLTPYNLTFKCYLFMHWKHYQFKYTYFIANKCNLQLI